MKMNFTLWLCVLYTSLLVRAYIIDSGLQIVCFQVLALMTFLVGMDEALEDRRRRRLAAMRRHPAGGRGSL